MFIKILLSSVTFPLGTWAAWANMHQSHLVMQMVIGVFISLGIFYAVLGMGEYATPPPANKALRAAVPVRVPARKHSPQRTGVRK